MLKWHRVIVFRVCNAFSNHIFKWGCGIAWLVFSVRDAAVWVQSSFNCLIRAVESPSSPICNTINDYITWWVEGFDKTSSARIKFPP